MAGSRISGWGTALPEKVLTNVDLESMMDTSDDWIRERTGISERRIGGLTSALAIEAGQKALAVSGIAATDIDLLLLATSSADQIMPATAPTVQHELGLTCGAFDLNAACSGFVYGLINAYAMAAIGYQRILLVGSDVLTSWLDYDDRGTAILFGDGAGALVMEPSHQTTLLGSDLGSDGSTRHLLYIDHGGKLVMEGREVFRQAVRAMVDSSVAAMDQAGVTGDDIALLVPHQANIRILDSACKRLAIPRDRTAVVLDKTGNTSAGSIPLALVSAIEKNQVQKGDLVLFTGFGAGMTWGSAVVRWDP
ncbi:MAG: beta-ketoacyl-ACP synthase III [Acidimicrobiales bacterium]